MFKKIIFAKLIVIGFALLLVQFPLYAESGFSSLQFDSTSELQGLPAIKSSCFVKGTKIRIEIMMQSQNSVFLSDGEKAYVYFPAQGIAMSVAVSQVYAQMPAPKDYKDIPGLKNLGQEETNGRLCDVYEYFHKGGQHKIWVAKDIDYPIKVESITDKGRVTTYIDNVRKNISLDDSLFQLPSGIQTIDAGAFKNIGNYLK